MPASDDSTTPRPLDLDHINVLIRGAREALHEPDKGRAIDDAYSILGSILDRSPAATPEILKRRPVDMLAFDRFYVFANDGTLWVLLPGGPGFVDPKDKWTRVPDLPQPEED